jgi:hypothetical protein
MAVSDRQRGRGVGGRRSDDHHRNCLLFHSPMCQLRTEVFDNQLPRISLHEVRSKILSQPSCPKSRRAVSIKLTHYPRVICSRPQSPIRAAFAIAACLVR